MSRPALPNARQILAAARTYKAAFRQFGKADAHYKSQYINGRRRLESEAEAVLKAGHKLKSSERRLKFIIINGKQPPNNWNGALE